MVVRLIVAALAGCLFSLPGCVSVWCGRRKSVDSGALSAQEASVLFTISAAVS